MTVDLDDGWDEDLPQQPQRPDNGLRWALAGGAVVLAAGALIARNVGPHHHRVEASTTPTTPATSPATSPLPPAAATVSAAPVLPPRPPPTPPGCAPTTACVVIDTVPRGVRSAFDELLPGAHVTRVTTDLTAPHGRLRARTILAHQARRTMTLTIRPVRPTDINIQESVSVGGTTVSRCVQVTLAFTISMDVREPAAEEAIFAADLGGLLQDDRLLSLR